MKGARLRALSLLASACTSESRVELQLVLLTDYRAYEEFVAMEVHVEGATGEEQRRHFVAEPAGDYVAGVALGEVAVPPGRTRIEATLRGVDGSVLLERPVLVTADSRRIITVVMTRDCAEVSCESDNEACVSGRCADATCTPEQPEACGTPQCEAATDCDVDSPCAVAECRSGRCLLVESADVCGGAEWCHPEEGCLPSRVGREASDVRLCPSETCLSLRSHLVFPHADLNGGAVTARPGGGVLLGFRSREDVAMEGASAPGGDDAIRCSSPWTAWAAASGSADSTTWHSAS